MEVHWVKSILRRARRRRAKLGRDEPSALLLEPESARAQVAAILDAYSAELRQEDKRAPVGAWIFKAGVDHELYAQAILVLFEDAERAGREKLAYELALERTPEEECVCRCRKHGKPGCRICLAFERCPIHSAVLLKIEGSE